jgi:NADPH-dependent 7-cyano-7-deazaguanine reductase QueF
MELTEICKTPCVYSVNGYCYYMGKTKCVKTEIQTSALNVFRKHKTFKENLNFHVW